MKCHPCLFTRPLLIISLAIASSLAIVSNSRAQTILSDSFSRTLGNTSTSPYDSDWGINDNSAGGYASQTYATSPDRTSGGVQQTVNGSQGVLRFGATSTTYDLYTDGTVLAGNGYRLEFDFTRLTAAGFVGVFFGAQPAAVSLKDANAAFGPINVLADYAGTVEAAFIFQNSTSGNVGRVQKFSYGVQQGGNFDGFYDDATTGTIGLHRARIDVSSPTGFGIGQTATFALSIDGVAVTSHSAILDGGMGSFGFSSNQGSPTSGGLIDNLIITTIPEPTSAALLGLGSLGLIFCARSRKQY